MSKYEHMTDEQLICKFRQGDKTIMDYLMEKYKNLVRKEANAMFLLGERMTILSKRDDRAFQSRAGLPDRAGYVFLQFCEALYYKTDVFGY